MTRDRNRRNHSFVRRCVGSAALFALVFAMTTPPGVASPSFTSVPLSDSSFVIEPGIDVSGVPEGDGQLVVGLDLRGNLPDVTKPDAELIAVLIIFRNTIKIIEPVAGVERRVSVVPERAASQLIGPRARYHLDLSGAATHLGVHGRSERNIYAAIAGGVKRGVNSEVGNCSGAPRSARATARSLNR